MLFQKPKLLRRDTLFKSPHVSWVGSPLSQLGIGVDIIVDEKCVAIQWKLIRVLQNITMKISPDRHTQREGQIKRLIDLLCRFGCSTWSLINISISWKKNNGDLLLPKKKMTLLYHRCQLRATGRTDRSSSRSEKANQLKNLHFEAFNFRTQMMSCTAVWFVRYKHLLNVWETQGLSKITTNLRFVIDFISMLQMIQFPQKRTPIFQNICPGRSMYQAFFSFLSQLTFRSHRIKGIQKTLIWKPTLSSAHNIDQVTPLKISLTISQRLHLSCPPRIGTKVEISQETKGQKCTFCNSKKIKHDPCTNKHHQVSHNEFASL